MLVCLAIVAQYTVTMRRAPELGFDRLTTSTLLGWAIGLGLVGALVFDVVAYRPQELLEDPLVLFQPWRGISSMGGMLGGILGLWWTMRRQGLSGRQTLRFVDVLVYALPLTLAIGRTGCALQHDHPGIASSHWLAVDFPDGPRFDLGLLEALYTGVMALGFAALGRRRWPDGFFIGLFFTLYGPVRFAMDALRISDVRYLGWTPGQYLSVLATLVGLGILAAVLRQPRDGDALPA